MNKNRMKRLLCYLTVLTMAFTLLCIPSFAANDVPGADQDQVRSMGQVDEDQVPEGDSDKEAVQALPELTNITQLVEGNDVTISWDEFTDADSYVIMNGPSEIYRGTACSFKWTGLTIGSTYTVFIQAFNGATQIAESTYDVVVESEEELAPPTNVKVSQVKMKQIRNDKKKNFVVSKTITINWSPADSSDVVSYEIFKNGKSIKTVSGTKLAYKYNEQKSGKFTYNVAAVYPSGEKAMSEPSKTITQPKFLKKVRTMKWYAYTNQSAKLYRYGKGNAYKRWLPKGVKGVVYGGSGSKFYLETGKSSTTGYVMRHKVSYSSVEKSTKVDWTKATKESYVKNKSSNTGYLIWISRYTQKINVFKGKKGNWKLVRTCDCSTGSFRSYSASGTFKIHQRVSTMKRSTYYYRYLSRFNDKNSIHTPCYKYKSNKMKKSPASKFNTLGCVRTWWDDALWVYKNVPMKTTVITY